MASLFKRAKDFAQSPKGKQLTEEVKEQASKPENRRKVKELGQRFMKKGGVPLMVEKHAGAGSR
jgi:hypothetical protein